MPWAGHPGLDRCLGGTLAAGHDFTIGAADALGAHSVARSAAIRSGVGTALHDAQVQGMPAGSAP